VVPRIEVLSDLRSARNVRYETARTSTLTDARRLLVLRNSALYVGHLAENVPEL
jgi:hypothetical protein